MGPSGSGRMLGRYQLLFMLGQGGMGEVHLARLSGAAGFEKLCIVKTVLPQLMSDPSFIDRFHHEARVLVQLTHSNIAQVYDMGEVDGTLYMAIEYVPGVDLSRVESRVERQRVAMPVPMAVYVGQQIAEALGYAHRKVGPEGQPLNIVHRDVSPQNVMVSYEGEVKVIDFGLAKSSARSKATLPSTVMGKLGYMSPEQALARPVDHRSDIFSAGIVVWEMLAGRSMYGGGTMPELVARMALGNVPPLREARPELSPTLEAVVMRALAKDPAARYQRADDFARALNELAVREQLSVGAEDVGNYVRAMCPEEFAAERQLQSQLSMLRKHGTVEPAPVDPGFAGTLVRPSQEVGAMPAAQLTPAQRATSLALTPAPPARPMTPPQSAGQTAPPVSAPAPFSGPVVVPRSRLPMLLGGLLGLAALGAVGFLLFPSGALMLSWAPEAPGAPEAPEAPEPPGDARPRAEAAPPVDAGPVVDAAPSSAQAQGEGAPREPEKPEARPEPSALELIAVDGKTWKVLRKGDEDLLMLDPQDKLREGDRLALVGEAEADGKRPLYARAAVLTVSGSIAKLLFDEDVPLPDKLFATRSGAPRPTAVVRREPTARRPEGGKEGAPAAEPEPPAEPAKAAEPVAPKEPVAEPAPSPQPTQLFGRVRISVPNVLGNRGVILVNENTFGLSDCEVRLPSNLFFKLGRRVLGPGSEQRIAFDEFRRDPRPADPQFRNDWSAVFCREGSGYWKTTYERR